MAQLQVTSIIPAPRAKVFDFIRGYQNLPRVIPSDFSLRLVSASRSMRDGAEYEFELGRLIIHKLPWVIRIDDFHENESFREQMLMGMFERWRNTYRFEDHGVGHTRITNAIEYAMPLGLIGRLTDDLIVRRDLKRLFSQTHENIGKELNPL